MILGGGSVMRRAPLPCSFVNALIALVLPISAAVPVASQQATPRAERREAKPQTRPFGHRVEVNRAHVDVDDGDTVSIRWGPKDVEIVRILGIDTPETRHPEHDLPYAQPLGAEARAFGQGAFAAAIRIELLRSATLDPFGRTLGYLFLNGQNYSVLAVKARLAEESISRYGDNGLPREAAEVMAAAKLAGPLPFESPAAFRGRMRELTKWLRQRGVDPRDVN
jgi:micrococcal nuclease